MITLEELIKHEEKEDVYLFYESVSPNPKPYSKISREGMYQEILSIYKEDPEIILKLISVEEINLLKELLEANKKVEKYGYIEYLLFQDLENNYLIIKGSTEYYIPEDLFNYVKMALNLFNQNEYFYKDIVDSIIIGLTRIYNALDLEALNALLVKYNTKFEIGELRTYIAESLYLKGKVVLVEYQNKEYITDSYFIFYEDVLKLRIGVNLNLDYTLEEVISIGKYHINLFKEPVLKFLNFLEGHLNREYIKIILDDLIVYAGMHINNLDTLKKIACDIDSLFEEAKKIIAYLPNWIINKEENKPIPKHSKNKIFGQKLFFKKGQK